MLESIHGNIVCITRLVSEFNDENLKCFEEKLKDALDCDSEAKFLCRVLRALGDSMDEVTVTQLKNETMALGEKQLIKGRESRDGEGMSLHQEIESRYDDNLSRLHASIIAEIGSFLNKKDSFLIGYLNRQLYIETQKLNYLKRRFDTEEEYCFYNTCGNRLKWKNVNIFSFCYLKGLELIMDDRSDHQDTDCSWIKECDFLFGHLKSIEIGQEWWLPHLSIQSLFSKRGKEDGFDKVTFRDFNHYSSDMNMVNQFCDQFNEYFDNKCNKNNELVNCKYIGNLEVTDSWEIEAVMRLLTTFGRIAKSISIYRSHFPFYKMSDVASILHDGISTLRITDVRYSESEISSAMTRKDDQASFANLKCIEYGYDDEYGVEMPEYHTLHSLNLTHHIDHFILHLIDGLRDINQEWFVDTTYCYWPIMYDILVKSSKKIPFLKTFTIKCQDYTKQLISLAGPFSCLYYYRDEIIESTTVNTINFHIRFESCKRLPESDAVTPLPSTLHAMFESKKANPCDADYINTNENHVTFENCNLSCQNLGRIYHCVMDWYARKYMQCMAIGAASTKWFRCDPINVCLKIVK